MAILNFYIVNLESLIQTLNGGNRDLKTIEDMRVSLIDMLW